MILRILHMMLKSTIAHDVVLSVRCFNWSFPQKGEELGYRLMATGRKDCGWSNRFPLTIQLDYYVKKKKRCLTSCADVVQLLVDPLQTPGHHLLVGLHHHLVDVLQQPTLPVTSLLLRTGGRGTSGSGPFRQAHFHRLTVIHLNANNPCVSGKGNIAEMPNIY